MAIKKSDLYSKIWKSCDELRGGMDASQYKDYILVILFMKYVTDKYYKKENALIYVPEGGSFKDMVAQKNQKDIGDKINKIISKLAYENDLKGIIDVADFNDDEKLGKDKDKVDRLTNLIAIFEDDNLNFSANNAEGDDILGDAYEYLMRHFATESGKSKGQFYTPAEVSRVMAKIIGIDKNKSKSQTIYDPTCGSGSLLLKAADEAEKGITIYGQENDNATRGLAKMNMILHGNEIADIRQGNTLSNPEFKTEDEKGLKTFDFAVANPPFSTKSWSNGFKPEEDEYKRFDGYAIPPAKNGDYAFLLHFIKSLKSTGKGAIILPHGVLFRGNTEADIREKLIRKGYIKGIIGLPANLFYGTGIPACIIVIDKEYADNRKSIFIIDASKGFIKDGNKNRLREQDVHKIVDVFNNLKEIPKYSKIVSFGEIEKNEFNLNIPRYIDNQEEEDLQNIEAHLMGDIPQKDIEDLSNYWEVFKSLKDLLFIKCSRENFYKLKVEKDKIKETIFENEEFKNYSAKVVEKTIIWKDKYKKELKEINAETSPKELIFKMSEDILNLFSDYNLIDKYDIYQHLMNYWLDIMKDDAYMIVENGWKAELSFELDKNGKIKADKWECELIPKNYIVDRYFVKEKEEIENLEIEKEEISSKKEEYEEENSGDEGVLEELKSDKGTISKKSITDKIKELKKDKEAKEELEIVNKYYELFEKEAEISKVIKDKMKELDEMAKAKYKELSEDDIKDILINDKWMPKIEEDIKGELERISYKLANRIKELYERYEETLPNIEKEVETFETKVENHLKRMGFTI